MMIERKTTKNILATIVMFTFAFLIGVVGFGCSAAENDNGGETESSASEEVFDEAASDSFTDEGSESSTSDAASSASSSESTSAADTEQDQALKVMESMTLEDKVAQLFVITPEQLTGVEEVVMAGDITKEALQTYPVGGLIYFAENLQDPDQTKEMLGNTQSYAKYGMFLSVDEEGGPLVARIANNSNFSVPTFPSMKTIGDSGDVEQAYEVGDTIGSYLSDLGFNMDFAPVADVLTNPDNEAIGSRSFGSDAQVDAEMVSEVVQGLQANDVLAVLKHFPGHGGTTSDSHDDAVVNDRTLDELNSTEFVPFEAGIEAGAQCVMVGHISIPEVTGNDTPSTLSYDAVTGILRDQLGFDGVVITDSMSMGAIINYYSSAQAAVMAIEAGCDIVLMPDNFAEAYEGVLDAVNSGELSEERINESVQRILNCKINAGITSVES